MKANRVPIFIISILSIACGVSNSTQKTEAIADSHHSAQTSLDWQGSYKGTLPCADCEGIETILTLTDNQSYELKTKYLGKTEDFFVQKGTFNWNELGNTIHLIGIEQAPNRYFVAENAVIQLDLNGERISGGLADTYRLQKMMPEHVLENTSWELIELMGKPIVLKEGEKPITLLFKADQQRVSGFSGCNSFMGTYELNHGFRIRFSQMASTMMACQDMEIERQVLDILDRTDNFMISDSVLSLNKARMAPLARFKALK